MYLILIADMSSLDSLGTNLSLVGSFDVMRIDIVVSETGDKKTKTRPSARKGTDTIFLTAPYRDTFNLFVLYISSKWQICFNNARGNACFFMRTRWCGIGSVEND